MGSSENVDSGKVTGQKSQFSQTCSLLSQFLKKKGSFGDLGIYRTAFEQTGSQQTTPTTTTMNLLPMIEKSSDSSSSSVETNSPNPMSLFPQEFDFCTKKTETWKSDQPEKAQMTIFYGGQVIVFDDFPADKANEIMKLANKQNPTNNFTYNMMNNQKPDQSAAINFGNSLIQEQLPKCQVPISQASVADLPIARRNSLTRFLEKRKDRITSIAPYQISNNKKTVHSKNEENKAWLGLAPQFVKTEQYF